MTVVQKTGIAAVLGTALATASLSLGAGTAHASPSMEWAWIGPYQSTWTCEQARDNWPVSSQPCQQDADGAYFYGMRQASPQ
jgi:hypothetical protein